MAKKRLVKISAAVMALVILSGCSILNKKDAALPSIEVKDSYHILFVGNSLTLSGDVPKQVSVLAGMYGITITYGNMSTSGAWLKESEEYAIELMGKNNYDIAIFQDYGTGPFYPDIYDGVIRELCDAARDNGTVPVIFNPAWPMLDDGTPDEAYQAQLTALYEKAAKANNAILVNAGDAWVYAYNKLPDIMLYLSTWDYHANFKGAYLTACTIVAALFDIHVTDLLDSSSMESRKKTRCFESIHGQSLDLAQAAWEYVYYYKEHGKFPDEVVEIPQEQ